MKNFLFFLLLLSTMSIRVQAQIRAITNTGEEVILYDNGTWAYVDGKPDTTDDQIPINPHLFTKSKKAVFTVESSIADDIEVNIDPKKWRFKKSAEDASSEYVFEHKEAPLYAMLIAEKIELPTSVLKKAALNNAREAAPDVKLTHEEYRVVNGQTVLMMEMKGTIDGLPFAYLGYYYSGATGTIQLLTYTISNMYEKNKNELEEFINGLIIK